MVELIGGGSVINGATPSSSYAYSIYLTHLYVYCLNIDLGQLKAGNYPGGKKAGSICIGHEFMIFLSNKTRYHNRLNSNK